jgi:hypothetical protein
MAYDVALYQRACAVLEGHPSLSDRKAFGGVCFSVQGNMCCGVHGDQLIVRVGPAAFEAALREPHVRVFDLTGRPMAGWVYVAPPGVAKDADLAAWIRRGVEFAMSLPPK